MLPIIAPVLRADVGGRNVIQSLLIKTTEDEEYEALQEAVILRNDAFADYPEEIRKFIVYYLVRGKSDGVRDVAQRAGISKSRAYELIKDPDVCQVIAAAAQAISDVSDVHGSMALDVTAELIYQQVISQELAPEAWTPTMLRICEACKSRLGLNPQSVMAIRAQDAEGNTLEAAVRQANKQDGVISHLLARQDRIRSRRFEADSPDSVQVDLPSGRSDSGAAVDRESGAVPAPE